MQSIYWFRNDLRVHDNPAFLHAVKSSETLLPVFVIDSSLFDDNHWGFSKTGAFRAKFLLESLFDLNEQLRSLNSSLYVTIGNPAEVLSQLAIQHKVSTVFHQAEPACEERMERKKLESLLPESCQIKSLWGSTLFDLSDLPFSPTKMPDVFTSFRKKCEKSTQIHRPAKTPDQLPPTPEGIRFPDIPTLRDLDIDEPDTDKRAVLHFKGGTKAGKKRVAEYIWEGDHLKSYKETRNGLIGSNYSSKFSPWLALGCISPRYIYQEVKRYEEERVKNSSTYWLIFELMWRDYWKFLFIKHDPKMFYPGGIQDKEVDWRSSSVDFECWRTGNTGFPFIDANMRELLHTGFMSNRGRQVVASFLAKNLQIDWRMGAAWFESQLADYDVYSNYGNWAYVAGVGTDGRDRYFNIVSQAQKYDTEGEYVHLWCPELKDVPGKLLAEFHTLSPNELSMYNVKIGEDYPSPIIDLEKSYERLRG